MIVFVDDELRLVGSYVDELGSAGFEVSPHASLDVAFDLLTENASRVELLILDVMAPTGAMLKGEDTQEGLRSGVRFYDRVRQQLPDLQVVILTNASDPSVERRFVREQNCHFRRKSQCLPFELAELVKELLRRDGHENLESVEDHASPR